jgi:hypothetical protein
LSAQRKTPWRQLEAVVVPGELLLYAHIGPEGDGYDEYVLDPAYLYSGNVVEVDRL